MNSISQKYFSKCIELGVVLRQPKPIRIGIENIFQYTALLDSYTSIRVRTTKDLHVHLHVHVECIHDLTNAWKM